MLQIPDSGTQRTTLGHRHVFYTHGMPIQNFSMVKVIPGTCSSKTTRVASALWFERLLGMFLLGLFAQS
jgi:hypothetical protein